MPDKSPARIPARVFRLASTLFVLSGATGLAYQVIWFKRFAHVWGSTSLAFAAVAGSFLFGLGLGAWLIGRLADRIARPLRWYGACELAIGVLALVIPFEIAALIGASVGLYATIPEQPLLRYLFQFTITLLVIGPPCVLMGGTLPLLIRLLTPRAGSLDHATGWLYAINTMGAATGCYLTGFHLLPLIGILWTNVLAAAVNVTIGLVALAASRAKQRAPEGAPRPPAPGPERPASAGPWAPRGAQLAAAFAGCGALVLEMTWSRQLALVLGGSTYAFTATLFVVLVGIALGSLIYHRWLRPVASRWETPLAAIGVLTVATLAGKAGLPALSRWVAPEGVRHLRADAGWNGAICVGASLALEMIPAVTMGLLFPLFIHRTRAGAERVGAAVGSVYAWNTLGSIAGAGFTAVLLFPHLGTAGAMALALGLYLLALLVLMPWRDPRASVAGSTTALVGAVAVVLAARPIDPLLTNSGMFHYGPPAALVGDLAPVGQWRSAFTPLFFREGASSNVLVTRARAAGVTLRVNGKVDGSDGGDMTQQLGIAYFPLFLAPAAKDIMVIGFGTGTTPGAALMVPGTRVTCCEIEPAVYECAAQFAAVNHRPYEMNRAPRDPGRFSMIFGDGRTALQGSGRKFDLILSEPSNPWIAGVSNLFTREFFRTARQHLNEGGVLAQWVQTYSFTSADYMMIVRTLRTEFPHYGVVIFSDGSDTVLLASTRPLLPDPVGLAALQRVVDRSPGITADLETWFGGTRLGDLLVSHYLVGEQELNRLVDADGSTAINTDLHLRLEFDAPLHLFRKVAPEEDAAGALLSGVEPGWVEQLAERAGFPRDSAAFDLALGKRLLDIAANPRVRSGPAKTEALEGAVVRFESALAKRADLAQAYRWLARARLLQGRRPEAFTAIATAARLAPVDARIRGELGHAFFGAGRYGEAIAEYRAALRLHGRVVAADGSMLWANNLAWVLAAGPDARWRDGAEAVRWAERACIAERNEDVMTLDTYAAALAEAGRFEEALNISQRIIELAAARPAVVAETRSRIELYRGARPYRMAPVPAAAPNPAAQAPALGSGR